MRKYYKYGKGPITDPIALVLLTIRGLAGGRGLGSEVKKDLLTLGIKLAVLVAVLVGVLKNI